MKGENLAIVPVGQGSEWAETPRKMNVAILRAYFIGFDDLWNAQGDLRVVLILLCSQNTQCSLF